MFSIEEHREAALEGAELGIWDWNIEAGSIVFDARWKRMLGYGEGEDNLAENFESWKILIHPDDFEVVFEKLNAHLDGKTESYEVEYRLRHRDGSWIWVLSKGKAWARDADGKALRVAGFHLNITQRKQAEQARMEAEKEARTRSREMELLLHSMTGAFVMWRTPLNEQGRLTDFYFEYFNNSYEKISGLKLQDVQGKSVHEVWPETEESWYAVYEEVARTGVSKSFEMIHAPTHGLYACNAYRPPPLPDRVCVVFDDIAEQRETRNRLQLSADQQEAILNSVTVGITLFKNRVLPWCNPEFSRLLGYDQNELSKGGGDCREPGSAQASGVPASTQKRRLDSS